MQKYKVWLLTTLAAVVVVVTVAVMVLPDIISAYKVRTVEGTITFVDVATRQASLEVKSPKDGHLVEIAGVVPEDCPIVINGKTATLDQVATGDRATVGGTWNKKTKQVKAVSIDITRTAEPVAETQPAGAL